jgi:hypothetical protein
MVRKQAAFHSVLVMCVSRSQNPMQSASDLPPPPGALGADSLGLAEEETPGESAMLGWTTPPVENCVCSCGESGAMGSSSGAGAAIADGGITPGGGGVGIVPIPEFSSAPVLPAENELPLPVPEPAGLRMDWDLAPTAGGVVVTGKVERIAPPPPANPEGGCTPDRPIPGEGVVAICDIDVIGREIVLP